MTELPASPREARCLGRVVGGSLSRGLEVRIDDGVSVEEVRVGTNVVITGEKLRFFGLVTDVTLASANPQLAQVPPSADPFVARVLSGTSLYGQLRVLPQLVLPSDATTLLEGPQKVKTVPSHGAPVRMASAQDMELVFGQEDERHFTIGTPLDMETKVCLDLEELVKRSNGIFGKTGTGKTFLTRILLSGIIQKGVAANLVFDMHSEYGWQAGSEAGIKVKGLKQLFPSRVAVFSLDEKSSQRRGVSPDGLVEIGYEEIEPEDMALLRQTLNLTDLAVDAVYSLERRFQKGWLQKLLGMGEAEEAKDALSGLNISDMTYRNLRRGVEKLRRLPFLAPHSRGKAVEEILAHLGRGMSVVLEFGSYDDLTAYVLVANILTRRIYERYRERTEQAQAEGKALPKPLVITIEEAHRFLNPQVSGQTIFGTIAREMRKFYVTLLVIDQRPSGIDEEVMSQLGTRALYLLDNEKDIDSALAGVAGRGELKTVLSNLENRQQVLLLGHALPTPLVVRVKDYGSPDSYREYGFGEASALKRRAEKEVEDLFR